MKWEYVTPTEKNSYVTLPEKQTAVNLVPVSHLITGNLYLRKVLIFRRIYIYNFFFPNRRDSHTYISIKYIQLTGSYSLVL